MPTELKWDPHKPQFVIHSHWVSFVVHFHHDKMEVDAQLTLTAKALATQAHRREAVRIIDSIVADLGL